MVPPEISRQLVLWMILCYIGDPGGYGYGGGANRSVFYSNTAAPRIKEIFQKAGNVIGESVNFAIEDKVVKAASTDKHIARRLEQLRDFVGVDTA